MSTSHVKTPACPSLSSGDQIRCPSLLRPAASSAAVAPPDDQAGRPGTLFERVLVDFEAILVRGDRDEREPLGEAEPLDEYERGTVLDPEDEEVLELLREIGEYERREGRR